MNSLKEALIKEIPVFRELGHKFVNKEVSSGDFKAMSGGMGSYAQRGGQDFMIRLRIPSGIMSMDKFKKVYELAKKQNLDKVHLTTRQAIQLHSLSIDGVCDTMEEALKNDIFTRGGGGNFPRNVSISPLSGVDVEEAFDVTPYAEAVNEHFMSKITTYKLPRKLKVSFSSSEKDCGNSTVADLGFLAIKKDNKEYFKVYIGGGIGKNPAKSVEFDSLINPNEILYHVEAITNLFIAEGDYENKNKARIRYIVDRMGEEAFLNCYKEHLNKVFESENLDVNIEYKEYKKQGIKTSVTHNRLIPQKQEGLYSVYFHPVCGQLSMSNYKLLIDKLDKLKDLTFESLNKKGEYILNHLTPETEYLKRYATLWTYFYKLYKEDPIKNDKLFFSAPAVIIVASNNELNGALAASKMDLMVDALGLGTFYSGFLQIATNDNNEILDFLHISDNKKIVACMVVGYPNVKYKRTVPRKAADIKWI